MKQIFISVFVFTTNSILCMQKINAQNYCCYKVKGEVDFVSKKIKKKDLQANVNIYVIERNNVKRSVSSSKVQYNGFSLSFGPREIERLPQDSLIFVEMSTNHKDVLVCTNWFGGPKEFSTKHGLYNIPPNVIEIPVRDADDRDLLLKTAQLYVGKNVQTGIGYYNLIDSANLDKNPFQKFITKIELAGAYRKAQDYFNQNKIFESISQTVDIDNLPFIIQTRFWKENYENKMLAFGVDSLKSRIDKIAFNSEFGDYLLGDSVKLEVWKRYVTELKNSEFGKKKMLKLENFGFDNPIELTKQKMIIADGLKIPEKFNDK